MAKGLDDLLRFLVKQVALQGEIGATPADVTKYSSEFYDDDPSPSRSGVTTVDRAFLEQTWFWLIQHPDIRLHDDHQHVRDWTLSQVEAHNAQIHNTKLEEHLELASDIDDTAQILGKEIRIFAAEQQIWLALTGHGQDLKRVPALEFQCLSLIGAHREAGIPQPLLVRRTGQDKRSLPERTSRLADKGYIVKKKALYKGAATSCCILRQFATVKDADGKEREAPWVQHRFSDIEPMVREALEIIQDRRIVTWQDLRALLDIPVYSKLRKRTLRALARFEKLGCIERVMTRFSNKKTYRAKREHRSFQFKRAATDKDWEILTSFGRDSWGWDSTTSPEQNKDRLQGDIEDLEEEDEEEDEEEALSGQQNVPLWDPDRSFTNVCFDAVKIAGPAGFTTTEACEKATGSFYQRSTSGLLHALGNTWLAPRPMELTILRDAMFIRRQSIYKYYTLENFQAAVDDGVTTWEAIAREQLSAEQYQRSAAFMELNAGAFFDPSGRATLGQAARSAMSQALKQSANLQPHEITEVQGNPYVSEDDGLTNEPSVPQAQPKIYTPRGTGTRKYAANYTEEQLNAMPPDKRKKIINSIQMGRNYHKKKHQARIDDEIAKGASYEEAVFLILHELEALWRKTRDPGMFNRIDVLHEMARKYRNALYTPSKAAHNMVYIKFQDQSMPPPKARYPATNAQKRGKTRGRNSNATMIANKARAAIEVSTSTTPVRKRRARKSSSTLVSDTSGAPLDDPGHSAESQIPFDETASTRGAMVIADNPTGRDPPAPMLDNLDAVNVDLESPVNSVSRSGRYRRQTIKALENSDRSTPSATLGIDSNESVIQPKSRGRAVPSLTYEQQRLAAQSSSRHMRIGKLSRLVTKERGLGPLSLLVMFRELPFSFMDLVRSDIPPQPPPRDDLRNETMESSFAEYAPPSPLLSDQRALHSGEPLTGLHQDRSDISDNAFVQSTRTSSSSTTRPRISYPPKNANGRSRKPTAGGMDSVVNLPSKITELENSTINLEDSRHRRARPDFDPPTRKLDRSPGHDIPFVHAKGLSGDHSASDPSRQLLADIATQQARHHTKTSMHHEAVHVNLAVSAQTSGFLSASTHSDRQDASVATTDPTQEEVAQTQRPDRNVSKALELQLQDTPTQVPVTEAAETRSNRKRHSRGVAPDSKDTFQAIGGVGRYGGGSLVAANKEIIMGIMRKCGGVFPGGREMWYPFNSQWQRQGGKGKPDTRTINTLIKQLLDSNRLKKLTFNFEKSSGNDAGALIIRHILILPEVSADDLRIPATQQKIKEAFPRLHVPKEADVDDELRRQQEALLKPKPGQSKSNWTAKVIDAPAISRPMPRGAVDAIRHDGAMSAMDRLREWHKSGAYKKRLQEEDEDEEEDEEDEGRKGGKAKEGETTENDVDSPQPITTRHGKQGPGRSKRQASDFVDNAPISLNSSSAISRSTYSGPSSEATQTTQGYARPRNSRQRNTRTDTAPDGEKQRRIDRLAALNMLSGTSLADDYTASSIEVQVTLPSVQWSLPPKRQRIPKIHHVHVPGLQPQPKQGLIFEHYKPKEQHPGVHTRPLSKPSFLDGEQYFSPNTGCFGTFLQKPVGFIPSSLNDILNREWPNKPSRRQRSSIQARFQAILDQVEHWEQNDPSALHAEKSGYSFINVDPFIDPKLLRRPTLKPYLRRTDIPCPSPEPLPKAKSPELVLSGPDTPELPHTDPTRPAVGIGRRSDDIVSRRKRNLVAGLQGPPVKRRRIKRSEREVAEVGDIVLAIAISKTLFQAGDDRYTNWDVVSCLLDNRFDAEWYKRKWHLLRNSWTPWLDDTRKWFEKAYLDAYEAGDVPEFSYGNLQLNDWPSLMSWTKKNIEDMSDSDPSNPQAILTLPASADEFGRKAYLEARPMTKDFNELKLKGASSSRRRLWIHQLPFRLSEVLPSRHESNRLTVDDDTISMSWVRANILTPTARYNAAQASAKLRSVPELNINGAVKQLSDHKLITFHSKGRDVPGRSYDISDKFIGNLKAGFEVKNLKHAMEFKRWLDEAFEKDGHAYFDFHAEDGTGIAVVNLLAEGFIRIVPENVKTDHGEQGFSWYKTRLVGKDFLRFDIRLLPTDRYIKGNPLLPLPPKPRGPPQSTESGIDKTPLPAWVDLNGGDSNGVWQYALCMLLAATAAQPGVTIKLLAEQARSSLGDWEIKLLARWAVEAGVATWEDDAMSAIRLGPWWWMALDEGPEAERAAAPGFAPSEPCT